MSIETIIQASSRAGLSELVKQYRTLAGALLEVKARQFPEGKSVQVDCDQYKGPGIVVLRDGTPPNKLAVRLGNGNVWWYPIECCTPINRENPLE